MRIVKKFPSYDDKKFGRPWIARVTAWPVGQRAELAWGTFLGDPATGGEAELEARPGDVVRYGQKDRRTNHDAAARWAFVTGLGALQIIQSELEAAKSFRQQQNLTKSNTEVVL